MAEPSIQELKTDERIADILKRLQAVSIKKQDDNDKSDDDKKDKSDDKKDNDTQKVDTSLSDNLPDDEDDTENTENTKDNDDTNVDEEPRPANDEMPKEDLIADAEEDLNICNSLEESGFIEESILPWFKPDDRDMLYIHYAIISDNGDLTYNTISTSKSLVDIANLKMKSNYVCDLDYYNSQHYVLFVKKLDSDYSYSRTLSSDTNIEPSKFDESVELSDSNIKKTSTEDITTDVVQSEKYSHYVVFTDLGIADFVAKDGEVQNPCCDCLSKWFEDISNYSQLKNANYVSNKDTNLCERLKDIPDYKYDIVTMHRPGIFTLDSVDNNDSNMQLNIKLKDEFDYIPTSKILSCIKYYSTHDNKSFEEFKYFINKYFDIAP